MSTGHATVDLEKINDVQGSTMASQSAQNPGISTESFSSLESGTTGIAGTAIPNTSNLGEQGFNSLFLHSYEVLSPESLRIASNWGNGTYDIVSNDLSFAMGPGDTFLDFNDDDYQLFNTGIGNNNLWPTL
jgi:hypothetical protein